MFVSDLDAATWRKSSHSNGAGGECVEVAFLATNAAVRDSKNTAGPVLNLPADEWNHLLHTIKTGTYDL
ncbi:DUF397 domain-containing protein [Actinomadura atramentaria]|uniref:DUF397 domain-containing protein n=1 Tax=Actinomadura atramentaria TaxID=1990 RepID=UPI00036E2928|nr:DUF397 domain-containing protein [Actinomadura atramentaria]